MAVPTDRRDDGSILVLALHSGGHYYGEMLAGVLREAAAAGRHVVVTETRDPGDTPVREDEGPAFDHPVAWDRIAGVVCIANAARPAYLERLRAAGIPVVVASEVHEGFRGPVALPDNDVAIEAAVQHLVDHGHTRIGFVGALTIRDFRERYAAYRAAMEAQGFGVDEDLYLPAPDFSVGGGAQAAERWLAHPDPPTAVVSATDANALGFVRRLVAAGRRVPEDVAVLGFDNVEEGAYSTPSLSSVGQRFIDVGALATNLLLRLMAGEDVPGGSYSPPTVVMARRRSCGCRADLEHGGTHRRVSAPPTVHSPIAALLATLPEPRRARLAAVVEQIEDLALRAVEPPSHEVTALLDELQDVTRDASETYRAVGDLIEHVVHLVDHALVGGHRPAGHTRVLALLWELQARGRREGERRLDESAIEVERVASALLRSDLDHTRSLAWLAGTHVRAGVFALWDGPPSAGLLRVEGVHDPLGLTGYAVGDVVGVRDFPGTALAAASDAASGEMCLVLPVAAPGDDRGMVAFLGRVETASVRQPYHHMRELLYRALEADRLQQAVQASEARYAWATRAANDGLWELDLTSNALYASDRCREILDLPSEGPVRTGQWTERVHPDDRPVSDGVVASALEHPGEPREVEYRILTSDGARRWVLSRCLAVPDETGRPVRVVGSLSDVTARRELEEQMRRAALYDDVTGLANRRLFLDRLDAAIRQHRRDGTGYAVVFLDLDGFKLINDSLGHLAGDDLLRTVATRLRSEIRAADTAARFGGDEFAVLLTAPVSQDLLAVADRLQQRIARPVVLGDHEVSVTASVGIATSDAGYTAAEDVLRDADTAMYRSKETRRGSTTVFDTRMHELATHRLRSRSELRTALEERQFVVHYQPIVPLDGAVVTAFEALVRWQHPERGLLGPGTFVPAMEDDASIVELGRWVTDEVCRQIAAWRADGDVPVQVSVNVSNLEFWADDLEESLVRATRRHQVPPSCLVLEITESVIMVDVEQAQRIMDRLRRQGFHLHVDDFGTGHSSLQALRVFPVDTLKIDGSFIRELVEVDRAAVLVRAMVAMAQGLGMDVIAECVETPEQAALLRQMGCGNAQGWLYARAVPGDEAGELLGRVLAPADDGVTV